MDSVFVFLGSTFWWRRRKRFCKDFLFNVEIFLYFIFQQFELTSVPIVPDGASRPGFNIHFLVDFFSWRNSLDTAANRPSQPTTSVLTNSGDDEDDPFGSNTGPFDAFSPRKTVC
jgi:hypothetical protein